MEMKWFQHPETEVFDHTTQFTDVRQFLQESTLTLEVDHAEMEAVAETFRGVENSNLHVVFHWEGSSGNDQQAKNEQERHKHNIANDHTFRANLVLQEARPVRRINIRSTENWVKLGESQRTRLLSYLWKILPQKTTSSKHSIELIEFARDLGNANSALQSQ